MSKVCIITGGTSGIGLATARAMHDAGYRVYELSRREVGTDCAVHIQADVTKEDTLRAAVDFVLAHEDHIDVVINNAGLASPARSNSPTPPTPSASLTSTSSAWCA